MLKKKHDIEANFKDILQHFKLVKKENVYVNGTKYKLPQPVEALYFDDECINKEELYKKVYDMAIKANNGEKENGK